MAKLSIKTRCTSAVEFMIILAHQPWLANAVILALTLGLASGQSDRAILAAPAFFADALIVSLAINTGSMLARIVVQRTLINVQFAVVSFESRRTYAGVHGNAIDAFAAETRIGQAFVDVDFTIDALVAFSTAAQVPCRVLIRKLRVKRLPHIVG